ncbi:MAG: DUF1570 domain-containing protein [Phycisphaerales bacterium]|nr:DUF1570 domain-containing protein [Phycisphaerales bacterium]
MSHPKSWPALLLLPLVILYAPPAFAQPQLQSYDGRHYLIHSALDKPLSLELASRLDAMYEEYDRRLAEFLQNQPRQKLEVYLFQNREDYQAFTGITHENSGGVFIPSRRLLAAYLNNQGRDALRRTLQHEAFHQFADQTLGPNLPAWLNEGLAQVFEEGLWTGRGFLIGQIPPRRIRQLQSDIAAGRLIDFEQFMALTPRQWTQNLADRERATTQYNQAWAMTQMLIYATDTTGKPLYRPRLIEMLRILHSGTDGTEAFAQAFSRNYKGFQDRLVEYARTLQPTPEARWIERQNVMADLLVELYARGKSFTDIESFRQAVAEGRYRMNYAKGDVQWSSDEDALGYFADDQGRRFSRHDLYFSNRVGAPIADLVCRRSDTVRLRTRFALNNGQIEHETELEPAQ